MERPLLRKEWLVTQHQSLNLNQRHQRQPHSIGYITRGFTAGFDVSIFVDQCQDTASRFVGSVPTYRLDWIVLSYSRIATGVFWDSCWWLRVGHHSFSAHWCLTRSVAFERRRGHSPLEAAAP